jgi:anti-sigma B factor antagonist
VDKKVIDLSLGAQIAISANRESTEVVVAGEIDLSNGHVLRDELAAIIQSADGHEVLVDLTKVSFIDSIGLGVLVGAGKHAAKANVPLQLRAPEGAARKTFELAGLDELFK